MADESNGAAEPTAAFSEEFILTDLANQHGWPWLLGQMQSLALAEATVGKKEGRVDEARLFRDLADFLLAFHERMRRENDQAQRVGELRGACERLVRWVMQDVARRGADTPNEVTHAEAVLAKAGGPGG